MSFTILIPARLASTRLPNKPLADIAGMPMIVRVAQRVSGLNARVVVACDHADIAAACKAHGVEAVLTRADHPSGSDRLAEACIKLQLHDDEIVVNVQGDEPLIDPELVEFVADALKKSSLAHMGTACHAIESVADMNNPNVVKVVLDASSHALYFSRSLIPFNRDARPDGPPHSVTPLRHIGIYSYQVGFLKRFPSLPQAPIEISESLEQLRALWHGYRIAVHVSAHAPGPGVDTPQDLERVRQLFASGAA
jgi:3-deoxy-manno-octulosonate cytidylyltransferase (CMP-KDO synthetase)